MPTYMLICLVTLNAVAGQLLLKHALNMIGGRGALATLSGFIMSAAASPWIYLSIAVQGLGYVLWMLLISREKLGVATASVGAGFYMLTPVCAWIIYGESLTNAQWFGIVLITIGVIFVSVGFTAAP